MMLLSPFLGSKFTSTDDLTADSAEIAVSLPSAPDVQETVPAAVKQRITHSQKEDRLCWSSESLTGEG